MSVYEERINGDHYASNYNGSGSGLLNIPRSAIDPGVANNVLVNDGLGNLSSISVLNVGRGGTGLSTTGVSSVFVTDAFGVPSWSTSLPPGFAGATSHSTLTGLSNDDHLQYALLAGRNTGQTLIGGINASEDLTLRSTSHVTKGKIILSDDTLVNNIDTVIIASLKLGSTTANKVEISNSGAPTEIKGDVLVNGVVDTLAAQVLYIAAANATAVEIADTGVTTSIMGSLLTESIIDTFGGVLKLGPTTATGIEISRTGFSTKVKGTLLIKDYLDTETATAMYIGNATAASVNLGSAIINTNVLGQLTVNTIDRLAAGALQIGPTVATSVSIANAGAVTNVQGTLRVNNIIDTITATQLQIGPVNATSIAIANSSTVTNILGNTVVKGIIDTTSNLQLGPTTATAVTIAKTGVTTSVLGTLLTKDIIDTTSVTALKIGPTNASSVEISKLGSTTTVKGNLLVDSNIDTAAAAILKLGATNATSVEIGGTNQPTVVKGDLTVLGTTTSVNSETLSIADSFLYLNNGYATLSPETGGLAVNYLPTGTSTTAQGSGFTSTTTLSTVATSFAANDIIQISGAVNIDNNGLYVVASHVANVLTISTTVYGWNQTQFVVSVDAVATIRKINVSVIRNNSSGNWEVGKGNTVPITYYVITTSPQMWTFQPVTMPYAATSTSYQSIGTYAFDLPSLSPVISFMVTYYVTYVDNALDIQIWDGSASIGADTSVAVSGIRSFSVTVPVVDKLLEVRIKKAALGGTSPIVNSVHFVLNA